MRVRDYVFAMKTNHVLGWSTPQRFSRWRKSWQFVIDSWQFIYTLLTFRTLSGQLKSGGLLLLYGLISLIILISCSKKDQSHDNGKINILATTGMIGDAVKNIARDSANVVALMGPGVDPHLYKATQGDLKKLQNADIIFYNGLHLEGKMSEIFEKLKRQKPVYPVSDGVPVSSLKVTDPNSNIYDPHIWFDVSIWKYAVSQINEKLGEEYPANKEYFNQNAQKYLDKLDSLHQSVIKMVNEIPEDERVLITAHDAFEYFGDAYGMEVKGLQGISTMSDYGLKDITDLVNFIIKRKIKAIFIETSVSERSINAVIEGCTEKGHDVAIGGSLYSDAMGPDGTFEGTYLGMVSSNVQKIVEALK